MSGFAAGLLNDLADYMINYDADVKPGEAIASFTAANFKVITAHPIEGDEDHYRYPVLRLVDIDHVPCDDSSAEYVDKILKEATTKANNK